MTDNKFIQILFNQMKHIARVPSIWKPIHNTSIEDEWLALINRQSLAIRVLHLSHLSILIKMQPLFFVNVTVALDSTTFEWFVRYGQFVNWPNGLHAFFVALTRKGFLLCGADFKRIFRNNKFSWRTDGLSLVNRFNGGPRTCKEETIEIQNIKWNFVFAKNWNNFQWYAKVFVVNTEFRPKFLCLTKWTHHDFESKLRRRNIWYSKSFHSSDILIFQSWLPKLSFSCRFSYDLHSGCNYWNVFKTPGWLHFMNAQLKRWKIQ